MTKVSGTDNPLKLLEALAVHPVQTRNKRKAPAIAQKNNTGTRIIFKSTLFIKVNEPYQININHAKQAGKFWRALTYAQQAEWYELAAQRIVASKVNAKRSTANANRKVKTRKVTAFSLYLQEYHASGYAAPLQPSDQLRGEPVQNIELLMGGDYEQRISQTIAETNASIDICVYQASANWAQNGVARTLLFEKLLALPSQGRTCRMVLAQPLPGTAALTFNVQARADMEAAGWSVRYAPPSPLLHAKFWLIEPYITVLGSHNLSNRAVTSNLETSIMLNKPSIYNQLKTKFQEIFDSGS